MPNDNDQASAGTLSRRDVLKAAGAVAGALAVGVNPARAAVGAMRVRRASPVSVTMFVFLGGALDVMPKAFKAWYEGNHKNVSITIYENSNLVGYPLMLAQKQQDPGKPFVNMGFFNAQTSAQGDIDGMWEKLDYGSLANAKDIYPAFKRSNQNGIGIGADQYGLLYNTQMISPAPTSWADLWNPAYAGKVTFFDYAWYAVYAAAKLNGGSLRHMNPGWQLWSQKAHQMVRTIVTSNPQYLQVLTNGTAGLTDYFNGTGLQWKRQGAPIQYVPPKEGAINVPVYLQSVKGNTPAQTEACHDIIDKMLTPKWCGGWMNTSIEVPANSKVKLPDEFKSLPAFQPGTIDKLLKLDWQVVAKANTTWRGLWDQNVKAHL
jgi:putative spermidine/putrescine transport system substrate-binding protein